MTHLRACHPMFSRESLGHKVHRSSAQMAKCEWALADRDPNVRPNAIRIEGRSMVIAAHGRYSTLWHSLRGAHFRPAYMTFGQISTFEPSRGARFGARSVAQPDEAKAAPFAPPSIAWLVNICAAGFLGGANSRERAGITPEELQSYSTAQKFVSSA
jgi:hypothetical protein